MVVPSPEEYRKAVKVIKEYRRHIKSNYPRELAITISDELKLNNDQCERIAEILKNEPSPQPTCSPQPIWSNKFPNDTSTNCQA